MLGIENLIIAPLLPQGQLKEAASRCSPCPLGLGYHYPVLPDSRPVALAPECQLDASRTASQWMSAAAVEPYARGVMIL